MMYDPLQHPSLRGAPVRVLRLPDRQGQPSDPAHGTALAALCNAALLLPGCGFGVAVLLRFGCGLAMSLVYRLRGTYLPS
jgi:hypothetical protein